MVPLTGMGAGIRLVKERFEELGEETRQSILVGGIKREPRGEEILSVFVNPHQDDETLAMGSKLIQDLVDGKQVYILQLTRGNATRTYYSINDILQEKNQKTITREELSNARTREMRAGFEAIGLPREHLIEFPYLETELKKEDVLRELQTFLKDKSFKKLELNTLRYDSIYDNSIGNLDHLACEEGVRAFLSISYDGSYPVESFYYLGSWKVPEGHDAYREIPMTYEVYKHWRILYEAYKEWAPHKGRYAVAYHSVPDAFEYILDHKIFLEYVGE